MKIVTIVGARPQFIKAGVVSSTFSQVGSVDEVLVHTGQHFDANMSDVFFGELSIPKPTYNLNIHGCSHGAMTGRMLESIEEILVKEGPQLVMVYGDTNSTLAGALAASKLHIPVVHVEAGLRSFNNQMPEEINRILTDQLSDFLYCPTDVAIKNLLNEGFGSKPARVHKIGDVMQDSALLFSKHAKQPIHLKGMQNFVLATLHRAENTDDLERLSAIVAGLNVVNAHFEVVIPLHPRTRHLLERNGLRLDATIIPPVGYFEMLWLLDNAGLVLTDSGGVQKEAAFFGKFCVTMRDQTEWVELVECGVNSLVGADSEKIANSAISNFNRSINIPDHLYGGGKASQALVDHLLGFFE